MTMIEVLFSPAEFEALARRDLSRTTCVVFDVLRATSTIITALSSGAAAIIPVATIEAALAEKKANPAVLLAGEREGFRITSQLTGSIDFDFGNSPREFTGENIRGKTIVMTTTNGTRALKACQRARDVLVGSFLNLSCLADHIQSDGVSDLLLLCSGTHEEASYEDILGAGALADAVWKRFAAGHIADSAQVARNIFHGARSDLPGAMTFAGNGRRLLGIPELWEDVPFCFRIDSRPVLARLLRNGRIEKFQA
jgi:2-phosphosulfolactate phosphatase